MNRQDAVDGERDEQRDDQMIEDQGKNLTVMY